MKTYETLTDSQKQIVIDIATQYGYGHPAYTNLKEIDYKFFEDCDMEAVVYNMAVMIDLLEQQNVLLIDQLKQNEKEI